MKSAPIGFMLAIIAAVVCLSNFLYKLLKFRAPDYIVLIAGVAILIVGYAVHASRNRSRS
jgi:hypothetical protein